MVEDAERSGKLKPGGTIVEPTSGNTGIGLAIVAAVKGYKLVLVMPDSMSVERRRLMLAYGARFELTPREKGMPGSIEKAKQLLAEIPDCWMPQQFENPANVEVHARTTAAEILKDFPEGLDYLITGVGTGGHITGCAQVLKKAWPGLKVYAVEPSASQVIAGGKHTPHPIQGIGAGLHTAGPRHQTARRHDRGGGRGCQGIRPAMRLPRRAAGRHLFRRNPGSHRRQAEGDPERRRVLGFNYDTGERYLSIEGFLPTA